MTTDQLNPELFTMHGTLSDYVCRAENYVDALDTAEITGTVVEAEQREQADAVLATIEAERDALDAAVLEAPIAMPYHMVVKAEVIVRLTALAPERGAALFRELADQVDAWSRAEASDDDS
jgi:hypothetical protein